MEGRDILQQMAAWSKTGKPFVMAVVVETTGSSPRKAGARMLVSADGLAEGTVGGGHVEERVIARAVELLQRNAPAEVLDFDLRKKAGALCGGSMRVFLEPFPALERAIVFGAGHVAAELVPLLQRISFHVVIYDFRGERLGLSAFSTAERIEAPFEELRARLALTERDYLIAMTPNHNSDYAVLERCIDAPWRYLGVIASRSKRAEFIKRLETAGIAAQRIAALSMPIGASIPAETPAEIAVAVAAEFLAKRATKVS